VVLSFLAWWPANDMPFSSPQMVQYLMSSRGAPTARRTPSGYRAELAGRGGHARASDARDSAHRADVIRSAAGRGIGWMRMRSPTGGGARTKSAALRLQRLRDALPPPDDRLAAA